jgi:hypothetical protein
VRGLENSKGFFQVDLRWARFVDLGGIVLLRIVEGGGDLASVVGRFPLLNFALPTTLEVENMRLEKVGQSYHLVLSLRNTGRDLRSVCIQLKGRELEETPIPKSNLGDINRGGCVVCAFPLLRGNLGGMRFVIEGTTLNDGKVILSKAVTIVRGGSGYELPVTR